MSALTRHARGFTLLEVLIALSIFSLIGLASYRMLDIVILSQGKVESHQKQIRTLERAMHIISNDFEQLIERPIRDNYGDTLKALVTDQENYLIEFTRQGWRNPLQLPRSQLQRVAYELGSAPDKSDNRFEQPSDSGVHLLRHYWPVLDRPQDSEPQTQVLMRNINDLQLLFLDEEDEWQSQWPQELLIGKPSEALPKAIMFKLDSQAAGKIERVYQLAEFSPELARASSNKGDDEEEDDSTTKQPVADPFDNQGQQK